MWVFVAGMVQDRVGHTEIARLGGLGGHMPAFSGWAAVAFLGAMGMPGLGVFAGVLLVLMGTFEKGGAAGGAAAMWLGVVGAGVLVLLMGCCVWTYQRVFLGAPRPEHSNVARMSLSERWILAILGLASLMLGVVPALVTEPMREAVALWVKWLSS
jgi:NADH-quinone oxidoreductase subunit M